MDCCCQFAVGNHLQITHTSLQEIEAAEVVSMEASISRGTGGQTGISWDSVFKTFVIVGAE